MKKLVLLFLFFGLPAKAQISQVAMGGFHACAVFKNGKVKCWGRNDNGQLGLLDDYPRGDSWDLMGAKLPFLDFGNQAGRVKKVSLTEKSGCVLFESGKVKCWGSNSDGQIASEGEMNDGPLYGKSGDDWPYVSLGDGVLAQDLVMGIANMACILTTLGKVKCWGQSIDGSLGIGPSESRGTKKGDMGNSLPFLDFGTTEKVIQIAVGDYHSCALFESKRVKCWGGNSRGELGLDDTRSRGLLNIEMGANLPFLEFGTTEKVMKIEAAGATNCAIFESGRLKCWGNNSSGNLFMGNEQISYGGEAGEMKKLPFLDLGVNEKVTQISLGQLHSCAVFKSGRLKCWGSNYKGALGLESPNEGSIGNLPEHLGKALPFVNLGKKLKVGYIAVGSMSACAVIQLTNEVKCWGKNDYGQIGSGDDQEGIGFGPNQMGDDLPYVDLGT